MQLLLLIYRDPLIMTLGYSRRLIQDFLPINRKRSSRRSRQNLGPKAHKSTSGYCMRELGCCESAEKVGWLWSRERLWSVGNTEKLICPSRVSPSFDLPFAPVLSSTQSSWRETPHVFALSSLQTDWQLNCQLWRLFCSYLAFSASFCARFQLERVLCGSKQRVKVFARRTCLWILHHLGHFQGNHSRRTTCLYWFMTSWQKDSNPCALAL